ncbi:response regulator [Nocardioides solisilvae]|uniref:response regulator n=1 Tax=Nocardioides solisilvae TaxID=1542435 RepID=UPI000D74E249|nr:response regulator transcription factor [Nocardioides solisilvae]
MRVVIAEDHALLRDGLNRLLEAHDFTVTAAVGDGPALAEALRADGVDVAVVDVRMPPTQTDEGLRVAIEARRRRPGLPVVVLSQYVEQLYARELLGSGEGSVGYLLKDRVSDVSTFVAAVRDVAAGGTVLDPEVVASLVSTAGSRSRLDRLTPREAEVLAPMAEGRSNAAIATRLVVTEKAVSKHIGNIFDKLDLPMSDSDHRRVLAVVAWLQT